MSHGHDQQPSKSQNDLVPQSENNSQAKLKEDDGTDPTESKSLSLEKQVENLAKVTSLIVESCLIQTSLLKQEREHLIAT